MSSHLVPGDGTVYDDKELIADLAALNERLSRYMSRLLETDAGRAAPVSVTDEQVFARSLRAIADRLQARANRHAGLSPPDSRSSRARTVDTRSSGDR